MRFDDLTQTVGDFTMSVDYDGKSSMFLVTVIDSKTNKHKDYEFRSLYEPRFGIDVEDMQRIQDEAERMCQEFEEEQK